MKKLGKTAVVLLLCCTIAGCGSNEERKQQQQNPEKWFDELNAAAKKSAEQPHLRVDDRTPEYKDIVCNTGKLEETYTNRSRAITDYDFENQRSITYYYAFDNANTTQKHKDGIAVAILDGKTIEKSFIEENGKREFEELSEPVFGEQKMMTVDDFNGVVKDDERSSFAITKEEKEDMYVYTLKMKDAKKMKEKYEQNYKKSGMDYYSWNGCPLTTREETDLKLTYHVDKEGYLKRIDNYSERILDEITVKLNHTTYYSTYDTMDLSPFQ